ncbi:MAG: glutaredoxin family protein [Anaerolineaceae bacterium]
MTPLQVTLYGNANCGLCAQAEAMLERLSRRLPLKISVIAIDSDPELQRRYVFAIPVVLANNREVARAPIYETALEDALRELVPGRTKT